MMLALFYSHWDQFTVTTLDSTVSILYHPPFVLTIYIYISCDHQGNTANDFQGLTSDLVYPVNQISVFAILPFWS